MSIAFYLVSAAFLVNAGIALVVASQRSDRAVNRAFLFVAFSIALWLGSIWIALQQRSSGPAEFWIRCSTASAMFMPFSLFLITRVVITGRSLSECLNIHWRWVAITAAGIILCSTRFFIVSVDVPSDPTLVANPEYGPAFGAYVAWFLTAFVITEIRAFRSRKSLATVARLELFYITVGIFLFNFLAVGLAGVAPLIWKHSQVIQLPALWVVMLDLILAYGISTQKLMGVSSLARRAASYGLFVVYLGVVYGLVFVASLIILHGLGVRVFWAPPLIAAVVMVLITGQARNLSGRVIEKLFVNSGNIALQAGLQAIDDLRFGAMDAEWIADRALAVIAKLAGTDSGFVQIFASSFTQQLDPEVSRDLSSSQAILLHLADRPLLSLFVSRSTRPDDPLALDFRRLKVSILLGIPGVGGTEGMIGLGERLTGRLYEPDDVVALRGIVTHLGTVLSNARLYSEQVRSGIYQGTVLQQLGVGVISANAAGKVTVVNREASRILGEVGADKAPTQIEHLPSPLPEIVKATIGSRSFGEEREVVLGAGTGSHLPVRVTCQSFADANGVLLGVSLTCHDISSIKLLQQQLVESDRLAGLGYFSATVAHEIKNPLVGLKTFAQLIPEKLKDEKFLHRLSEVVNSEVDRIDKIVRQLLSWGKPTNQKMVSVGIEDVLDEVLALYRLELRKRKIHLTTSWPDSPSAVLGDRQRLQQVFSNLVMNAMEAMPDGGTLRLETRPDEPLAADLAHRFDARGDAFVATVRIVIADSGVGIAAEKIERLFGAFGAVVSSKAEGSGFGLAIVKEIIQQHGGVIAVKSQLAKWTEFQILLPKTSN